MKRANLRREWSRTIGDRIIAAREVLGDHPRKSPQRWMELRLYLKHGSQWRQFWVVVAEREDAGRFIVRADEKLTAFMELESVIQGEP